MVGQRLRWVSVVLFSLISNKMHFFENINVSLLAFKPIININITDDSPVWDPMCTICMKQFQLGHLGFRNLGFTNRVA